ncbi:TonB family protein [Candidatus Albibeggiatoa sp. nov. NOAA]|uniref:TonB family protein n=1 Tax=Candidatus Albibeggiatoa sp. nov. NOAA TaxID=3162724 RepID=UPI0032F1D2C8|nr:energy transducer TonB [Thiotrichaceae bacterium]
MFFSALLNATSILAIVFGIHAVAVWGILQQPKPIPEKQVKPPVQISFIQLNKPVAKPVKVEKSAPPAIASPPKPVRKINTTKKPKPKKLKPRKPKKVAKKPVKQKPKKMAKPENSKTEKQTTQPVKTASVASNVSKTTSTTSSSQRTVSTASTQPIKSVPKPQKPRFNRAYLHQPKPPYTRILRRLNAQGTVTLRIVFAQQGHVKQVSIISSSGSSRLDNHAVQYVKKHWQYNPPQKQQQWSTVIPIRFQLQ